MAEATFVPRYHSQEGFVTTPGTTFYEWNAFGGNSLDVGEEYFVRFADVDLPAGATITAAYVDYSIVVKDQGDPNGFTYDFLYEAAFSASASLHQCPVPFQEGKAEDNTLNRNWTTHATGQTFTWNTSSGISPQILSIDITSRIQNAFNTNAGRHCSFSFKLKCLSETGEVTLQTAAAASGPRPATLRIVYTGGTPRNEIALYNYNSNFTRTTTGTRPALLWYNNSAFGTFSANPTYEVLTSDGAVSAPQGGKIYKITATETNRVVSYHFGPTDLASNEWYRWSGYVYSPTGVSDIQVASPGALWTARNVTTLKDTWVRLSVEYFSAADLNPMFGFSSVGDLTTGQSIYIANCNLTRGRQLYPYFDGDTTDSATYHRTFDWGGGSLNQLSGANAFVTFTGKPTVTPLNPQPSGSSQSPVLFRWTYDDPDLEGNFSVRAEVRKKRVP